MNKTAVDFLKEKLTYVFVNDKSFNELFQQAKAMEKEQIIKFADNFDDYLNYCSLEGVYPLPSAEQYYNETFKSE